MMFVFGKTRKNEMAKIGIYRSTYYYYYLIIMTDGKILFVSWAPTHFYTESHVFIYNNYNL